MTTAAVDVPRRDYFTISLIGLAHGTSHFFQLVLPPLFPLLIVDFGVSYTQLGVLMTTFFITSGIGQPIAGFLVDRFGARRLVFTGLAVYATAIAALSLVPQFWMFFPVMMCAALGNCVFHPSDFTILNANVHQRRLGKAYGIHTLGGNLGWALAPTYMLTLAHAFGWRWALVGAAALGAVVWLLLWRNRNSLREEEAAATAVAPARGFSANIAPLISAPILLCFTYFLLLAAALIAVQNFLPPILGGIHGTPLVLAGTALTGFLLGASGGVVVGGVIADRSPSHTMIIVLGLLGSAAMFLLVASVALATLLLVLAVGAAGFLSGVTTPSRDLLVRSATPKGATGRVFGFVYSGLDVGSALAPVSVGLLLDHDLPQAALWLVAAMLAAAIFTAVSIRGVARQPVAVTSAGD